MRSSTTEENYRAVDKEIAAVGSGPKGMKPHTCFGEGDQPEIFEVRETKEDFEIFASKLGQIIAGL